jgi:hypothetical protein
MSTQKPTDWKTYRNEHYGFRIDVPSQWAVSPKSLVSRLLGRGDRNPTLRGTHPETLSIMIGRLRSEPTPGETERQFIRHASGRGLRDVEMGRFMLLGKEHVWMRYFMQPGIHVKKYLLVLGGTEYSVTAFLGQEGEPSQVRDAREQLYDEVLATFRLDS